MKKRLTYRQLFQKLKSLGYREEVATNGTPQRIFRHPDYPRATIFLPEMPLDEAVTLLHQGVVRMVLTNHGVARIDPDQLLVEAFASDQEGK